MRSESSANVCILIIYTECQDGDNSDYVNCMRTVRNPVVFQGVKPTLLSCDNSLSSKSTRGPTDSLMAVGHHSQVHNHHPNHRVFELIVNMSRRLF